MCIVCYCYRLLCTAGRYGEHQRCRGGIILRELCLSSTIYLYRRAYGHCTGTTCTAFGVNKGPSSRCPHIHQVAAFLLLSQLTLKVRCAVKNAKCLLHVGTLPFFQRWIITSRTLNVAHSHMKFSIVGTCSCVLKSELK